MLIIKICNKQERDTWVPSNSRYFMIYMTEEESTWLEPWTTFPLVTATIYIAGDALLAQRANIQ